MTKKCTEVFKPCIVICSGTTLSSSVHEPLTAIHDRPWMTRFTGQSLPVLRLDLNGSPADRRRLFLAKPPAEIKVKAEGRHGLT
jgi:hypothetical protein